MEFQLVTHLDVIVQKRRYSQNSSWDSSWISSFVFSPLPSQPIGPADGGLPPPWCGSSVHFYDISGEDIFQSRTVLIKPTLSALGGTSGPFLRGKPLRRRSIFQGQLPAGKAGVPCIASDRPTYLIDLPLFPYHCFAFAQVFAPERQGKTRDSTEEKSRGKP